MTDERPRKRAWGKTKNRGKGPPLVDPLDSDMDTPEEPVKRIKINTFEEPNHHQTIDLQSPELMSDSVLVEVLSTFKVPIPVYSDGTPSRERLIYLFKKHVTPQPQRTRGSGRFWRKRISAQRSSTNRVIPLEMDIDSQQEWSDITDSDASTVNSTNKRKRYFEYVLNQDHIVHLYVLFTGSLKMENGIPWRDYPRRFHTNHFQRYQLATAQLVRLQLRKHYQLQAPLAIPRLDCWNWKDLPLR